MSKSTVSKMTPILREIVSLEKDKEFESGTKKKAQSNGVISSSEFVISIIERYKNSKNAKKEITSSINSKVRNEIYSLMKAEDNYAANKTNRIRLRIYYHESMVDNLQLIRRNIESNC